MKSLLKIIFRYSVTAGVIIFAMLIFNVAAFMYWGYRTIKSDTNAKFSRGAIEEIGQELYQEDGRWEITGSGMEKIENMECQWIMALDEDGAVVWEWQLPDDFARAYSLQDVAGFFQW